MSWITSDAELRDLAEQPGDGFEFMGQGNPTGEFWFAPVPFWFGDRVRDAWDPPGEFDPEVPIESNVSGRAVEMTAWPVEADVQHASYHQKLFVMDDAVAYLGGMNMSVTDWDTSAHKVFEHRRMPFDATTERVANSKRVPGDVHLSRQGRTDG